MGIHFFAQTLFYLTTSIVIIVLGVLLSVVMYRLISVMKHLDHISRNLDDSTEELRGRINGVLEALEKMPFLSFLFKKRTGKKEGAKRQGKNNK